MQSRRDDAVPQKMEETRVICNREISIQQQRIQAAKASFQNLLHSITATSQQTLQFQGIWFSYSGCNCSCEFAARLGKLKAELREMEDTLVKALAVKTRKETKRMAMEDSLSVTKAKLEEVKGVVEDKRAKKDEYAEIISEQSEALLVYEEKYHQNVAHREEIEEAILWYNRVLGFCIECGYGVKFIFTNINSKNPDQEYSFRICHGMSITRCLIVILI